MKRVTDLQRLTALEYEARRRDLQHAAARVSELEAAINALRDSASYQPDNAAAAVFCMAWETWREAENRRLTSDLAKARADHDEHSRLVRRAFGRDMAARKVVEKLINARRSTRSRRQL